MTNLQSPSKSAEEQIEPEEPDLKTGPFALNPILARQAGSKGGTVSSQRHGHEHYQEIGKKGGEIVKRRYGPDYYALIGQRGGLAPRRKKTKAPPVENVQSYEI